MTTRDDAFDLDAIEKRVRARILPCEGGDPFGSCGAPCTKRCVGGNQDCRITRCDAHAQEGSGVIRPGVAWSGSDAATVE